MAVGRMFGLDRGDLRLEPLIFLGFLALVVERLAGDPELSGQRRLIGDPGQMDTTGFYFFPRATWPG